MTNANAYFIRNDYIMCPMQVYVVCVLCWSEWMSPSAIHCRSPKLEGSFYDKVMNLYAVWLFTIVLLRNAVYLYIYSFVWYKQKCTNNCFGVWGSYCWIILPPIRNKQLQMSAPTNHVSPYIFQKDVRTLYVFGWVNPCFRQLNREDN